MASFSYWLFTHVPCTQMMNEKQFFAGNIRDMTFHVQACHATNDKMWKCGHWVKRIFPFRELCGSINFCIQFMWQKGSTFLAILTPY
jgi:hypothetical protein